MIPDNLQDLVLQRLTAFPNACFVTDTQVVLDPAEGSILNLDTLIDLLRHRNPDVAAEAVIDHYVSSLTQACDTYVQGATHLPRREILGKLTRLVFPEQSLPSEIEPDYLAPGLVTAWGLFNGETVATMPKHVLSGAMSDADMERAAKTRIRAYARGVRVEKFFDGVLLSGGRQTSSIGLYPDFCAKALKLSRSEAGWFVALPSAEHALIVPVDDPSILVDMAAASFELFASSPKALSWSIFHHLDGELHPLLSDQGLTPTFELELLHGPVATWPILDGLDDDGLLSA